MDDTALLNELAPVAEQLLERHLDTAKEWFPHEMVPWSLGRDFEPGEVWQPGLPLDEAAVSALFLNTLTEDNLPYYSMEIQHMFGVDHAWGAWARRWTAEEGRHSIVMRDWLTVTRAIDPVMLERGRMSQVSGGIAPHPDAPADGLVYVTLQELATRISHTNTGKVLGDRPGNDIMKRVAADENLHYLFYRDVTTAGLKLDPSKFVLAIERQVRDFAMPGVGIPDFNRHAAIVAKAGIYDFAIHHDKILVPVVLNHWKVESLEGLSPEAEEARERLVRHISRVGKAAKRRQERRQAASERAAEQGQPQDQLAPA